LGNGRVNPIIQKSRLPKLNLAYPLQNLKDWITQEWVITTGIKIDSIKESWLLGPFGNLNGIGEEIIYQLAEKENLNIKRNTNSTGLLSSIKQLNFSNDELNLLSKEVINFYEKTVDYNLSLKIEWNPYFKIFGVLLNYLFSKRLKQLYIPTSNHKDGETIKSEIIHLVDPLSNTIKYTIWLRKIKTTEQIIFSGIYGTTILPSGQVCVKVIFPLPMGNATVILLPSIKKDGSLSLHSIGQNFGETGFYFLLKDSKENLWAKYVKSFHDTLTVGYKNGELYAEQNLSIWNQPVLRLNYKIRKEK
jgi:hypothetical protein